MTRGQKCAVLAGFAGAAAMAVTLTSAPRELVILGLILAASLVTLIFAIAGESV
jgi:hypothetical protein